MAIEINKRKRKHQETTTATNDEETEPVVPKKVPKKSNTPKKQKNKHKHNDAETTGTATEPVEEEKTNTTENELETDVADMEASTAITSAITAGSAGYELPDKQMKFSTDFKMLNFRAKLRGTNFMTELRHFLRLTESRPKIVPKYIEKRGKPLELAEALERIDKSNILHVAYICEALQLVVMEILTNQKAHMESAISACRYFLKAHGAVIGPLLKSAHLKHRCIALKLLTVIVCVEPQLGRQLLSSYDILTNAKLIDILLSHSKHDISGGNKGETVRKCYIHFVLAFLVDGNTVLIRNILDRGSLIKVLVRGLVFDDHVTVCVVLSTLRKYVLECPEISKTKKINIFDFECCKSLAQLYSWRGPNSLAAKFSGVRVQMAGDTNPLELEAVSAAVHDFLLVLLTSRKHGICFDAMTHYRQKHNTLQGKIIGSLYLPYIDVRKTELVIKILETCPELARHTVRNFAGIANPMRTSKKYYVQALLFLSEVISTLKPKLLEMALNKMTLTDLAYWIKEVCLPIEALSHVVGTNMLRHASFPVRMAVNRLLLAMFTQYSNYMSAIATREQSKRAGGNSLRRFKFDLLDHILVNFPTMENILLSLNTSITAQAEDGVEVLQHLELSLDLILIICKENRSFVNQTSTILDYLNVLRPLYASDDDDDTVVGQTEANSINLELKAIKTILLLYPAALEPDTKLFASVLRSFINAYVYGDEDVQLEAGNLLWKIFKNTGIFDASEYEIDLWLAALRFFDKSTVQVVTNVFTEVLQVTNVEVEMPIEDNAESTLNDEQIKKLFENIEKGHSVQAYVETLTLSKLMPLIFKGVAIVKPLDKYLETVCLLLFHYYTMPGSVLRLYEMEFTTLGAYMKSWLPPITATATAAAAKPPQTLQVAAKIAKRIPQLMKLYAAVMCVDKEQQQFEFVFCKTEGESDKGYELQLNGGKLFQLSAAMRNKRLLMIYIQQILFIVSQLVELKELTIKQADIAANYIIKLLMIAQELEKETIVAQSDDETVNECSFAQMLQFIYAVRLNYVHTTELFSAIAQPEQLNYLHFISTLTAHCRELPQFDNYATNYRLKLVKSVAISLQTIEETKEASAKLVEFIQLLKAFNLNADNCLEILQLLTDQLKYADYFVCSQRSIYMEMLVCILERLAALKQPVECSNCIKKLQKYYINFNKHLTEVDVAQFVDFEKALHEFLIVCHQYINIFEPKFFKCFFNERKMHKDTIRLACLLLERSQKLQDCFPELLASNIDKKELIYPLLDIAFKLGLSLPDAVLQACYQAYKNGFMKTIEKPQKAAVIYKDHAECSIALVINCMPKSECIDFCHKNLKFDGCEIYQLRLIHAIYQHAFGAASESQQATIFVNFNNLLVQLLSIDLKKQIVDMEKLELSAYLIQDWWERSSSKVLTADYGRLLNSQQWLNFCKVCLKLGMQHNPAETELERADKHNGLLLKLLAFLIDHLYTDYVENELATHHDFPAQIFELICAHSRCYDILLSNSSRPTHVKTQLLHLLYTLAKKSPQSLQETQIPIMLGAYHARLTDADRYALMLLELYELYNVGLEKYRPFIWGETAIAFYALRATDDERHKLQLEETSIGQVLSLIDKQLCVYTIDNFPVWRALHSREQIPLIKFPNPLSCATIFGTNPLEQKIEAGVQEFSINDLRHCPKRATIYEQCYDPAFMVPLMSMCFSPESYVHAARPVENGLLSLVFAALSSQDRDMRLAAACAQQRYRAHFEQSKFYERPLWEQAYDNIQSGLNDLRLSWIKHKGNSGTPRAPLIPTLFIARTFNLINDPTHLLYKQLTMYLRLKSSFNFQTIPEFNILFYSTEVEHHTFRKFIVEVIRDGIKTSSDLFLLLSTNTFKVLMGFYGSTISNLELNLLILSVFSTCVKIPASTKIMCETIGILPWLSSVISSTEFHHFDIIEGLITIVHNLWYAMKANIAELHNFKFLNLYLYRLIMQLLPLLSPRISVSKFSNLLNILQKTATVAGNAYVLLSPTSFDKLLECASKHYPLELPLIQNIRIYGGAGAETHQAYCTRLYKEQQLDTVAICGLSSLRAYCIDWWQAQQPAVDVASAALADVPK